MGISVFFLRVEVVGFVCVWEGFVRLVIEEILEGGSSGFSCSFGFISEEILISVYLE